jgi:hypothetical protein
MKIFVRERLSCSCRILSAVLIVLCTPVICSGADQETSRDSPVVTDGRLPTYPVRARMHHFESVVRLEVSMEGDKITKVTLLEGQLVLGTTAIENVKTWRFRWHTPTTFETIYRYKLLPESACDVDNPTIVLRLPVEVEVTAKAMKICDSSSEIKRR